MSKELLEGLNGAVPVQESLVLGQVRGRLVLRSPEQELLLSDQLAYIPRIGTDVLQDGKLSWKVRSNEREAICELIARHRLGLDHAEQGPIEAHIYLESPSPWWLAWLDSLCDEGEVLLCSLRTGETQEIQSAYDGKESVDAFVVWTDRRVFVALAGKMGDTKIQTLARPLRVESSLRRSTLVAKDQEIEISSRNTELFTWLSQRCSMPAVLWKVSVVAKIWGSQGLLSAQLVGQSPGYADDPALGWAQALWDPQNSELSQKLSPPKELSPLGLWSLFETSAGLSASPPNPVKIGELDAWLASLSVEHLRQDACFENPWPLGRFLAAMAEHWPSERAESWVALLDHLCPSQDPVQDLAGVESSLGMSMVLALCFEQCGQPQKANHELSMLIQALPGAQDLELLLGEEDAQAPIRHLLDALVTRCLELWPKGAKERQALLETRASLVPLSLTRLAEWIDACGPEHPQYARRCEVRAQLQGIQEGAQDSGVSLPELRVHALTQAQIDTRLIHPAAQGGRSGSWQAMLAKLETPDHSALKRYCDPGMEGVLAKEVARVASVFGQEPIDVFISHGDRRFGVQAFEGEPSFLLVGGEHRRVESPAYLEPTQLRFTLGAELAHLYLGHARVTSQEILSGAFDKGKATFEVLTSVVPFLSAFPWGQRLGRWTGYFDNKLVSRSARRIGEYLGLESQGGTELLTLDRSVGLIAAHRMIQLTADRAGLLMAGHLGDAIVAMWKLRPESLEYLELLRKQGLLAALDAMTQAGSQEWRILATRAAALTAFALSEEYQELQRWVWESPSAHIAPKR